MILKLEQERENKMGVASPGMGLAILRVFIPRNIFAAIHAKDKTPG